MKGSDNSNRMSMMSFLALGETVDGSPVDEVPEHTVIWGVKEDRMRGLEVEIEIGPIQNNGI